MQFLIVGAVVIVLVLAGYALYLHRQLRARADKEQRDLEEVQAYVAQKKREAWRSVQVLSSARDDDRITLTEIALRIKGLTQNIELSDESRERMAPVFGLATATASLPIGDEWVDLTNKEKIKYKAQRLKSEARYAEALEPVLSWLSTVSYDQVVEKTLH